MALCDRVSLFGAVGIDGDSIAFVPDAARGLWRVSSQGGEIIYFKGTAAYSVTVTTTPQFTSSRPQLLFKTSAVITNSRFRIVDISRHGSRIAMMAPVDDPENLEIRVVLNWLEELKRLVPIGGQSPRHGGVRAPATAASAHRRQAAL